MLTKYRLMQLNNTRKRTAWFALLAVLGLTLVAELFIPMPNNFGLEGNLFFYAWFGFLSCAAIVIASKLLGLLLSRSDDYYTKEKGEKT